MTTRYSVLLGFFIFFHLVARAQWVRLPQLAGQGFVSLQTWRDTLYAASMGHEVYRSADGGQTWTAFSVSAGVDIRYFEVKDGVFYAGTLDHGLYRSTDRAQTWQAMTGLPTYNLPVTSLTQVGQWLYATTDGSGVYGLAPGQTTWEPLNTGLPTYSYNVHASILAGDRLIIAAGANGTYYRYDAQARTWQEHFYFGMLRPAMDIHQLVVLPSGTLFGVRWNMVVRSDDGAQTWVEDHVGARNRVGPDRGIRPGQQQMYIWTNAGGGGTWIQRRPLSAPAGTSWQPEEEFFAEGYTWDLLEYQGRLFMANQNGLYVRDRLLSDREDLQVPNIVVYPQPASRHSGIRIETTLPLVQAVWTDMQGREVAAEPLSQGADYELRPGLATGLYLLILQDTQGRQWRKKVQLD